MSARKANLYLLALCFFLVTSCSPPSVTNQSSYLLSIDGKETDSEEFLYQLEKNFSNSDSLITKEEIDNYLGLFINFKLKVYEAESLGYDTTATFKKEYDQYLNQLYEPYLSGKTETGELVKEAYQRMQEEVDASHLLLKVGAYDAPEDTFRIYQQILRIREELLQGTSFDELVAKYSEEPNAEVTKGRLGYFSAFQMVYPFETAAYNTDVGDVSMPVRTRFGYHLIKVHDRRPARGTVVISHIMLRLRPEHSQSNSIRIRDQIFEIHEMLQQGADWDLICSKHSEDVNTREKGGRLPEFGPGKMIPSFDKHAFELTTPGQVSDPFQSRFGWHIIRLEKRNPIPPFDQVKKTLETRVSRDSRSNESKAIMMSRLKNATRFVEDPTAKAQVFQWADSTLIEGRWQVESDESLNLVLFTISEKQYLISDFTDYVVKYQRKVNNYSPGYYMDRLYHDFVEVQIMEQAKKHLEETSREFRMLKKEYREGILLFDIMQHEVWSKAATDTVALKAYYQNQADKYNPPESCEAIIITGLSGKQRDEISAYLSNHQEMLFSSDSTFNAFKNEVIKPLQTKSTLTLELEKNFFERGESKLLDQVPWTKGLHYFDSGIIIIGEVAPPGVRPFNEVKGLVIADYQDELEKELVEKLKQKYEVRINEDQLQKIYARFRL